MAARQVKARNTRVLIASRLFTPEVGAAAFRLQALAEALASAGASVRVLTTMLPKDSVMPGTAQGFKVSRFPVMRDAGGYVRGYLQYLSFDIPLFFRLLFARADIVVAEPPPTTGLMVAVTSWLRRRPYVYYAADIWSEALAATSTPGLITTLIRWVESHVLRCAARVLAVSDGVSEKVVAFGVDPNRVETVGNGIDTSVFTLDGPLPEEPVGSAQGDYFVYAGTFSEWQGADVFVRAMPTVLQSHPEARVYLFGQGSAGAQLTDLSARLAPNNVIIGGIIPPRQAAAWLRGAVCALVSIVPGQGYDFAKPTKIYAAAACGTPVLFTGAGAAAELVQKEALGFVAEYSVAAVADAMCRVLNDHAATLSHDARIMRADWAFKNASLTAAGTRAAGHVLDQAR